MRTPTAAFAILSAALLAVAPACKSTTTTAGGTTATYNQATGNLSTSFAAPLDEVWAAAQAAVDELQFRTDRKSKDALQGILQAETASGDDIRITARKQGENITEVTIGVGPLGKESTARTLLEKMEARLD